MNEFFGSMITMDDPKHFRLRSHRLARASRRRRSPRSRTYVEDQGRRRSSTALLERFPEGECDFVTEVAAPLPLQIICEMMGIPRSDDAKVFEWTNSSSASATPSTAPRSRS